MKTSLLFKLTPMLLLAACGKVDPVPYDCLVWVNNFYIEHPVQSLSPTAAGWLFRGAKDTNGQLTIGFMAPRAMSDDAAERRAILNMICPRSFEKIWQMLPSENKLVIKVWTSDKKFKDSIKC